ncbi:MAG TPA: serine/threonine-protein kinase [Kofleriaceae bacterium]|nr:serine/threonine-protein kinase [Kofleriaceae bacterium]
MQTQAGFGPARVTAPLRAAVLPTVTLRGASSDALADALLEEGTRVGDFLILGLLGEGAMGQVYLAQDVTLGRRVALKLVKRAVMQGGDAGRFLEEARATASFNHPHIVTLHAVGEYVGRPYLALEYLDGESLRARLAAGPLPVAEALLHGRAIALAIAEAHRRGIVHADLKPDNVVLPRDGRLRVVDFGLAKLAGGGEAGMVSTVSGTPAYMAPERWRGAPPTCAIDIWAFGVMLHELITGRRPIPDAMLARLGFVRGPLPLAGLPAEPWALLVRDCLALEPASRPDAAELVRRLALLQAQYAPRAAAESRCPFPGLAAFTREDAAAYFGRRAKVAALAEQLRTRPLVPVVGPARVGKSSFLFAALLPHLEAAGGWIAIAPRLGARPFDSLAAALALPDRPAATVAEALRRSPDGLARALGDVARHHGARVLLLLDQLEEAFGSAAAKADARALCDALGRAASAAAPWRIVLGVRDDLLDRLVTVPSMRPHLGGVMRLGPLSAADLRAAITGPLAAAGYEPDAPALVERILRDVEAQPGCLPLLQLACRALWERRDPATRRILSAEYEVMGGAAGALAAQARRAMTELSPPEIRIVRALLLALFGADGTRRPRRRGELLALLPEGARERAGRLLALLLERHLLVEVRPPGGGAAELALAHGALDAAWHRLARWLDETHDARAELADVEEAALGWHQHGRRCAETWTGAELADLARKLDRAGQELLPVSPHARAFLAAGRLRERRELQGRRRWRRVTRGWSALVAVAVAIFSLSFARKALRAPAAAGPSRDRGRPAPRPPGAGKRAPLALAASTAAACLDATTVNLRPASSPRPLQS